MSNQITPNPSVPSQVVAEVKFPRFINNLGIIPTSYKDSMSYYECLAWLCKYLEETVIPTVNQNGEAVEELQALYVELNSYVTHYFDNLDVQEEINNKLDNMVEAGTLQEIIADYLNSKAVFGFDNVEDMTEATNLIEGSYARTLGYHEINDSGSGLYKIRTRTFEDVVDNGSIILMEDNTLVAELISIEANVKQFGAKGDNETNDSSSIQNALTFAKSKNLKLYFPKGEYILNSSLLIDVNNFELYGEGKNKTIIHFSTLNGTLLDLESMNNNIHDIQLQGSYNNNQYAIHNFSGSRSARNKIENVKIRNFDNGIILETNYNDCNIIRNCDFVVVGNCISIKQNDNGIIENCTAEPFTKVFCELFQPNACAIRNCLVNTPSNIFDTVNSSAFIITGNQTGGDGEHYGSAVTIENIHSEYVHQFALIGISDVSIKDIFIWNNSKNSNLNMFHFINYSGNPINNCNLNNIWLDEAPFSSGYYGIYKANYSETSFTAANGKTYNIAPQKFMNLKVNGFNSTVQIATEITSNNYSSYEIRNNNVIYSNDTITIIDNIGTIPNVNASNVSSKYYLFGKSINKYSKFITRYYTYKYDVTSETWYPETKYNTIMQGLTVNYTPLTKNGIILLSINAKEEGKYANCVVIMRSGLIKHITEIDSNGLTIAANNDNNAVTITAESYQNPFSISENNLNFC